MEVKMKKLIALTLAATLTSGCATILSESRYSVSIQSAPSDSKFTIENRSGATIHTGRTPQTIMLNSGAGFFSGEKYKVTLTKEGFEPKTITIDSGLDGWYFGNILFGGLIGILIVDPASGAMFTLPESVSTTLDNAQTKVASASKSAVTITTLDTIPEEQRGLLIPLANK